MHDSVWDAPVDEKQTDSDYKSPHNFFQLNDLMKKHISQEKRCNRYQERNEMHVDKSRLHEKAEKYTVRTRAHKYSQTQ